MKTEIKFTEDFAGKEKGQEWKCDSLLASQLVNRDKVAVYTGKSLERYEDGLKTAEAAQKEADDAEEKRQGRLAEDAKKEAKAAKPKKKDEKKEESTSEGKGKGKAFLDKFKK